MQRYLKRAIELLSGLALTKTKNPAVITPCHSKSSLSAPEARYFKRIKPAKAGVSPSVLSSMIAELEAQRRANIHNLMVIKNGSVILECSAPGYDVNTYALSHSMSKTVTAIAIGYLVEEYGLDLSTRLVDIFPEIPFEDKRFPSLTVEHLLSMRSGVPFSEIGTATESEWTETFFASELTFAPGEKFHYNSLNSYILAKIIRRITGMGLVEFLTPRLFAPLGIENLLWEISPEGCEKGGFGLYLSAESWSKIGVMLLNMGVFEGRQIMPRSWILRMITERSVAPAETGAFNYGYHVWVNRTNDEFLLNGMLGQNVWICPKNGIVVTATCGNRELFQGSPALDIIRRHLGGEIASPKEAAREQAELTERVKHFFEGRHIIRPRKPLRGLSYLFRLRSATPFDESWLPLLGEYAFPDNNVGILPLFVSVMQNNYGGGIERMAFRREGDRLYFSFTEGGIMRELEVGIYGFKTGVVTYGGESYIVNAIGEAMEDEDRNPVFKLELVFPELPNSRLIKLSFVDGRLSVRLSETPDNKIVEAYLGNFSLSGKMGFAMNMLEKRLGENFIERKVEETFFPRLIAIPTKTEGWAELLLKENVAQKMLIQSTSGFIAGLITKFVGEEKDEKKDSPKEKRGGIFGLFGKRKKPEPGESVSGGYEIIIENADSTDIEDGGADVNTGTDEIPENALPSADSDGGNE